MTWCCWIYRKGWRLAGCATTLAEAAKLLAEAARLRGIPEGRQIITGGSDPPDFVPPSGKGERCRSGRKGTSVRQRN
jgi:hypothetical protein